MCPESIVANSWCAAFLRRVDGRIAAWNRWAESLFAVPARAAVGRQCFEVIGGRDVYGNDYCGRDCASWRMAASNRPVHPFRLTVTVDASREIDLRVTIFPIRGPEGPALIHVLEPLIARSCGVDLPDGSDGDDAARGCSPAALTRREVEVLRCLAAGSSTDDIASRLRISPATVRNHVASCLRKLEVHSRVEAIGVAHRLHLV